MGKGRKLPTMQQMDTAFAASRYTSPKYTMRSKVEFGSQIRSKMSDCNVTSGPIDVNLSRPRAPAWACGIRYCETLTVPGQSNISVPGPGAYPNPTTLKGEHPTLERKGGSGNKWGNRSAPRFSRPFGEAKCGPGSYFIGKDVGVPRAPGYSMRPRLENQSLTGKKSSNQATSVLNYTNCTNKGPITIPGGVHGARFCATLTMPGQSNLKTPGPGHYPQSSFNGSAKHRYTAKWSFGSNPRFKIPADNDVPIDWD